MSDSSPTPPPPPPGSPPAIERKLSPGVLLLIAILAMVFFIFGLLHLLAHNLMRLRRARRRRRRVGDAAAAADDSSPTAFQGQLQQLFHLHDAGVDQAFIDALPVFPYRAVIAAAAAGKDDHDAEAFDCAVCLCEFADDDKLRLLPTCGHAFHVPCIDAWLLSHSTCPLCRGSILADADYSYSSPSPSPSSASLLLLHHHSYGHAETGARDGGGDPEARDGDDESPKDAVEEIVEVKLGKLRSVDGNASARDLAADVSGSSNGNASGRGSIGQRRCLSMGSYEYVMDDHAALRVTIKATTPKTRPASSRSSRRRHALSACDLGCPNLKKAGAWETAVTEAAADGRCSDGAASLSKDSFSTSKIWMTSVARREEDGRRPGTAAEPAAGERRAASFRWPAMASGFKRHRRGEEPCDVEAGGSGDNGVSSSAMLWVAGGWQGSHS